MTTLVETVLGQSHRELKDLGVIMKGHFERHDNRHSAWYFHSHPLFWTGSLWRVVQDLVAIVPQEILSEIDVVAGPQFAGNVIAQGMINIINSQGLPSRKQVHCVPIERKFNLVGPDLGRSVYSIRRYYAEQIKGLKVLFVDDAIASDTTRVKCARLLEDAGCQVLASICIADLSLVPGVNQHSLWQPPPGDVYDRMNCPMCRAGELITKF